MKRTSDIYQRVYTGKICEKKLLKAFEIGTRKDKDECKFPYTGTKFSDTYTGTGFLFVNETTKFFAELKFFTNVCARNMWETESTLRKRKVMYAVKNDKCFHSNFFTFLLCDFPFLWNRVNVPKKFELCKKFSPFFTNKN